jgi:hypothetical protein
MYASVNVYNDFVYTEFIFGVEAIAIFALISGMVF